LYFAISSGEMDCFARSVFLFSSAEEFQQWLDSGLECSRYSELLLVANQIGRSILRQRVPRLLAFLQVSTLQERTSSHAAWICAGLLSAILM
jgi:hypothetical protein